MGMGWGELETRRQTAMRLAFALDWQTTRIRFDRETSTVQKDL